MDIDYIFKIFEQKPSLFGFGVFWLFCAVVTAFLAANRGRNSFKWFAMGLLLGPFAFALVIRPSPVIKDNHHESTKTE